MDRDERLKVAYNGALTMITYEGHMIWSVMLVMITANGITVALGGALVKEFPEAKWAANVIAVLGFFICVAWLLILVRMYSYYRYWHTWARITEKDLLSSIWGESTMLGQGADSEPMRPPIPTESGHTIRSNVATLLMG